MPRKSNEVLQAEEVAAIKAGFKKPPTVFTMISKTGIEVAVVDPLTGAAAVVGIVSGISSFFGGRKSKKQRKEIIARLKIVSTQLITVDKKIDQSLRLLSEIGIAVNEIPMTLAKNKLEAYQATLLDNIADWKTEKLKALKDGPMPGFRLDHQVATNELLQHGYAHYLLSIKSMLWQLSLSNLLELDAESKKPLVKRYVQYLENAISEAGDAPAGNFGRLKVRLENEIKSLESQIKRANKRIFLNITGPELTNDNLWGYQMCRFRVFGIVEGSLEEGFVYKGKTERDEYKCYWVERDGQINSIGPQPKVDLIVGGKKQQAIVQGLVAEPAAASQNPKVVADNLNSLRATYFAAQRDLARANDAITACKRAIDAIQKAGS